MTSWDSTQGAVFALRRDQHASILGAPGTGKSRVLVEVMERSLADGYAESDVVALSPTRLTSRYLRTALETRAQRALSGTLVRTATSFAFALLARDAALVGAPEPRLMTGTAQDELVANVLSTLGNGADDLEDRERNAAALVHALWQPEVLHTPTFRAEMREFWRVIDDGAQDPSVLREELLRLRAVSARDRVTEAPDAELMEQWEAALALLDLVQRRARAERPDELSASGLLRAAAHAVRAGTITAPKLILVDDAQEFGEGPLALLAACAASGSAIWVFGDPDIATAAFQGEPARLLEQLHTELARRGAQTVGAEQRVVLNTVHRHGPTLRAFVHDLTRRLPSGSGGVQRSALSAETATDQIDETDEGRNAPIVSASAASPSEQAGIIAHRMRLRGLGVGGRPRVAWNDMAVVCRSRRDVIRMTRALAQHRVPTEATAGGMVLREHQVVRDLILLLQMVLGLGTLSVGELVRVLQGPLGALDPVAVRRLRGAIMLQERRAAAAEAREPRSTDHLLLAAGLSPAEEPVVDSAAGRALYRLARTMEAGKRVHDAGGTAREVLWALWDATRLGAIWQGDALAGRGVRAEDAHRALDAVLGLFFALQRHEEQDSRQPLSDLLTELLESTVPEDSLAQQGERAAVTVTTPQGVIGREFALTVVVGAQDGEWPNTRPRGSLLGTTALERWLRGLGASGPTRAETIHDELRLFVHACARSTHELLVVAIHDDDVHPSAFFRFGRPYMRTDLPSSRVTLRGLTAEMRRRLTAHPQDNAARATLARFSDAGIPGAHPDEWYGVLPPSSSAPLFSLGDPERPVPVSPSQLDTLATCPLNWVIQSLGGRRAGLSASLGTLVHAAFEEARDPEPQPMLDLIAREWEKLPFDAEWESARSLDVATEMVNGLSSYLEVFAASGHELLGREASFRVRVGDAELHGLADRLEAEHTAEGTLMVTVVDLKTGKYPPSKPDTEQYVQLQAYQLGIATGAFTEAFEGIDRVNRDDGDGDADTAENGGRMESAGAKLLYVHPEAASRTRFLERTQPALTPEERAALEAHIEDAAHTMAASEFRARVEHHCTDPHQPGACRIHIIPAVSHG